MKAGILMAGDISPDGSGVQGNGATSGCSGDTRAYIGTNRHPDYFRIACNPGVTDRTQAYATSLVCGPKRVVGMHGTCGAVPMLVLDAVDVGALPGTVVRINAQELESLRKRFTCFVSPTCWLPCASPHNPSRK
jgi:hypothetical protein